LLTERDREAWDGLPPACRSDELPSSQLPSALRASVDQTQGPQGTSPASPECWWRRPHRSTNHAPVLRDRRRSREKGTAS
jgi:hypothetical protein